MKKISIISYPSDQSHLLSLCEHSSRYELYFGGRFRVIDCILSIALSIQASEVILFEPSFSETLETFCSDDFTTSQFPPLRVKKIDKTPKYTIFIELIESLSSDYLLFLNGDNPILGDFKEKVTQLLKEEYDYGIIKVSYDNKPYYTTKALLIKKDLFLQILHNQFSEIKSFTGFFNTIINMVQNNENNNGKEYTVYGYFHTINNLVEYYNTNMDFIRLLKPILKILQNIPIGNIIAPLQGEAFIRKQALVSNSIISDNCQIYGQVKNSILFPNVTIYKKAVISNSIILPNTVIAENCVITRTIIDETFEALNLKKSVVTIGEESEIGKDDIYSRNAIYPEAIYSGVTLIGPNCILPRKIKIGAGCYVKGGTDRHILKRNTVVKDSETV